MNKKTVLVVLIGVIVIFIGADYLLSDKQGMPVPSQPPQVQQMNYTYKNITSLELGQMLTQKDFFFVNVHVPYEGEIEKTDALIPYNEIENKLDKLPKDKNAKIVLYCRSGRMSAIAAEKLASLGYTNIYNQTGGMIDWEKQGHQLIKK